MPKFGSAMIGTFLGDGQKPITKTELRDSISEICADIRRGFVELKQTYCDGRAEMLRVFYSHTQRNYERIVEMKKWKDL